MKIKQEQKLVDLQYMKIRKAKLQNHNYMSACEKLKYAGYQLPAHSTEVVNACFLIGFLAISY